MKGETVTPATIVPDADKVQWAARVLLDADNEVTDGAIEAACDATDIHPMTAMLAIVAALRSLAGSDTP